MSNYYKESNHIPTEVLCARLEELSKAVTKGRESIMREFTMRIPAERDRDADLVLAEAARRLRSLETGIPQSGNRVQGIKDSLRELFGDTKVPPEVCRERLEEIREEIEGYLDTINEA